ncbi:restriction endonuclease subunit S [Caulobacter sp. 602-2]|uniref:Restriction endonuclease subunit S n=1 Tax=Caulobacter sp. 602-2 TaxID=2710887 RepID=A0A6G4R2A7_9CAUL|nr:restriction endonuclease subunit S [Caulobacter sp. 602-2]NGM51921.1 restriction endonuclease subunit S [Caulobacter sp. 602-2]
MNEWTACQLGDVLTLQRGFDITKATQRDGSVPVVSSSGINSHHDEAKIQGPGVIIGRKGTLGTYFYLDEPYWPHDTTLWVKDFKGNDPKFCFYLLGSMELAKYDVGAANPTLNRNQLHLLPTARPELDTQRRIASILGSYDDLIEVNRRRVAALEEIARGLFEEWFVHFRFPGHENAPLVESPDGPLPQGWTWGPAKELVAFDPKTKVPKDGYKPFIPMGHLDTVTSLIASPESRTGNSGAKFRNDDTLFARITPCLENGKTGLVRNLPGGVGFGSTEFIVMRGERSGPAFAYCLSRLPRFRDHAQSSMSGASGRQRARTESVETYTMAIPASNDPLDRFESTAWPMLELVGKLGSMNERLAASRDLLLPRLISGQLSVDAAERELELAA